MRDDSNDAVCYKEMPFRSRVDVKEHFGFKTPENPKFRNRNAKFPAKSVHSNNFWTVRDRRKISAHALNKIRVGESNGDAISVLGRHLVEKTTSGPILKVSKSRIMCQRLEVDEKCRCNTNSIQMSGYWLASSKSLRRSTKRPKLFPVRFLNCKSDE
jgi:hypothetical protein